ncbi:MAG: bifunctional 4-hydroxy-2-oxoglutarate aldolase/2-dehydro-3-deoxy-phosphogluconate aldolase [Sedimentisphaerales bacterium]|nr:bifunctional 4-hydroxy-2-oxoglutarate aldolase/2-dehydro-3-deoxy-phosphogluconate aldolase [Sedimentisphaerales bacterium]
MAKYSRLEVLTAMKQIGIIPVFYNGNFDVAKSVIAACADGGARAIEFTNRGDRAVNVFTKLAEYRDSEKPEIILGAGSICDAPTAAMYISAGADFVVGPLLDEDVAKICNGRKIPYSPGCGTVSEIHKAEILGVEICKIFPGAEVGGPAFVKSVKGPCPWTEIMPTGGVSPTKESLSAWFNAGVACVGMGSNLITKELLAAKDFAGITKKVKETFELIKQIRSEKK